MSSQATKKDAATAVPPADGACQWEHVFGGQAVMEGVMMRGRYSWGVAVRRPSGDIARFSYPLKSVGERHRLLKFPVIRGVVALFESLTLGVRALGISANVALEATEPETPDKAGTEPEAQEVGGKASAKAAVGPGASFGWKELTVTLIFAGALAVGLFVVIPLVVVKAFEDTFSNPFVFNLVEGLIRIVIFIIYISSISLLRDLRRVFEYHGAEHKVIHARTTRPCTRGAARASSWWSWWSLSWCSP
jgi:uncharacterized protein YqhQ